MYGRSTTAKVDNQLIKAVPNPPLGDRGKKKIKNGIKKI
jgi:hypothetical protein